MINRIVISESQYSRLFLNEQSYNSDLPAGYYSPPGAAGSDGDYATKRKRYYDQAILGLKQNGVETKFIPSYDEIKKVSHENTQNTIYNIAGYNMVKDIEWFKGEYWGNANGMCRWVDITGYGNGDGGNKLKDLNPDGALGEKISNRAWLPPKGEYTGDSEKNMKTNFPWMVYWLLSDFRSGGGMSIEQHVNGKGNPFNPKILGDNNWIQWLNLVYGTQDINKIKSMITQSQKDNYAIGNYMNINGNKGCHMERDLTTFEIALGGVGGWLGECAKDYHCLLDIASIVALVIPVAGIWISAGLDLVNATSYYAEGNVAAGTLTGIGAMPLFGRFLKLVKPQTYRSTMKWVSYVYELSKGGKTKTEKAEAISQKYFDLKLDKVSESEQLHIKEFLISVKKNESTFKALAAAPKEVKGIATAELQKHFQKMKDLFSKSKTELKWVDYKKLMKNKKFEEILQAEGDILKALDVFSRSGTGRQFLMQIGLFASVEAALPPAMKLAAEKGLFGVKNQIQIGSYDWDLTKEIFGSSGTKEDNLKLQTAWEAGWRPYDEDGVYNEVVKWEPWQTDTYKEKQKYKDIKKTSQEKWISQDDMESEVLMLPTE